MENITDADYAYAKRVWKDFEIKNVGKYLWFVCLKQYIIVSWYIWGLLEYVCWNVWTRTCSFSYCTKISMERSLKNDKSKIRSTHWFWYSRKKWGITESQGEYFMLFINMWMLVTNTWKIMIKICVDEQFFGSYPYVILSGLKIQINLIKTL